MKTVFEGFRRDDIESFASRLQEHGIFPTVEVVEGTSGLDAYHLVVEDHEAETASILIEGFEEERSREANVFVCPKCGSKNVTFETIENENSFISETTQLICRDCAQTDEESSDHSPETTRGDQSHTVVTPHFTRERRSSDIALRYRVPFMHFIDAQIGSISRMWIALSMVVFSTLAYRYLPNDQHFTTGVLIFSWIVAFSWIAFFALSACAYYSIYKNNSYTKLVVSAEGIFLEDLRQTRRIEWEKVRFCSERAETFNLNMSEGSNVVISKDALLSAKEYSNFLNLMKRMGIQRSRPDE